MNRSSLWPRAGLPSRELVCGQRQRLVRYNHVVPPSPGQRRHRALPDSVPEFHHERGGQLHIPQRDSGELKTVLLLQRHCEIVHQVGSRQPDVRGSRGAEW